MAVRSVSESTVRMWAVYDHPKDYPASFVVREWHVDKGIVKSGEVIGIGYSLEFVRSCIPSGAFRMPRNHADDPVIVEIWI